MGEVVVHGCWAHARYTYRKGSGPGLVHEIPGITPKVLAYAEDVVAAGFTVVMPSLVGTPGRGVNGYLAVRRCSRCASPCGSPTGV